MKKEITRKSLFVLLPLVGFGACYLLGAFFSASFNIGTWHEGARFAVVACGIIVIIVGLAVAHEINSKQWKQD